MTIAEFSKAAGNVESVAEAAVGAKASWLVWMLNPAAVKQSKVVVQACDRDEAWKAFCELNGIPTDTVGGRVIRPATESEVPKE